MAFESLAEQSDRDEAAHNHVAHVIELTRDCPVLRDSDRHSMMGALGWLRVESIRQAGLRLCEDLGPVDLSGVWPADLYNQAYDIRNGLAHPSGRLPPRREVSALVSPLEKLVQAALNSVKE